jgi:16S rRNA (guanine527-N7)-methyltransferase
VTDDLHSAAAQDSAPAPFRAELCSAAAQLGLPLEPVVADRLLAYLALLQRWNRVYNLSALRDPAEMLTHHLLDCLAVVPALQRHAEGRPLRILDVGSGGGLPGVVLAIMHPQWSVTCVDTVAKKASFVRQVAGDLALPNLRSVHARVENMPAPAQFDLIVSRAFASLADFTSWSRERLAPGGVWLAMKGRAPDDEVAALSPDVSVFHVEPLHVPGLQAQRCLVWLNASSKAP